MAADDFFSTQLLECQWRGRGFPCSAFHVKISQSLVHHERPDQDSANIEATGRKPMTFTAHIPFRNSVAKGPAETWQQPLYPTAYLRFVVDIKDRSTGILQHPSLGTILCKPSDTDLTMTSGVRDGEDVVANWIETIDPLFSSVFTKDSGISGGISTAIVIDKKIALLNLGASDPDNGKVSFEDSMRSIQAVFDKASLLSKQSFGIIARVQYRIDSLVSAITSLKDPQNWELKGSLSKLTESLTAIKQAAGKGPKHVSFYVTPGATTVGAIATKLSNKTTDLILLNPDLVKVATVPADTLIRYYAATTQ